MGTDALRHRATSVIRRPFEKFVDWRQCATVMQKEAVTLTRSCGCGVNVVVA
jgi:hypothetical protein